MTLPRFRVQLYEEGLWDGRPSQEVIADDALAAAEGVAGESLVDTGMVADFRASV